MFTSIQRLYSTNGILGSSTGYPAPICAYLRTLYLLSSLPYQAPNGGGAWKRHISDPHRSFQLPKHLPKPNISQTSRLGRCARGGNVAPSTPPRKRTGIMLTNLLGYIHNESDA